MESNSNMESYETYLRNKVAEHFKKYIELTQLVGLKSLVLDEHMAELYCWEPDVEKLQNIDINDLI